MRSLYSKLQDQPAKTDRRVRMMGACVACLLLLALLVITNSLADFSRAHAPRLEQGCTGVWTEMEALRTVDVFCR